GGIGRDNAFPLARGLPAPAGVVILVAGEDAERVAVAVSPRERRGTRDLLRGVHAVAGRDRHAERRRFAVPADVVHHARRAELAGVDRRLHAGGEPAGRQERPRPPPDVVERREPVRVARPALRDDRRAIPLRDDRTLALEGGERRDERGPGTFGGEPFPEGE